MPLEEYFHPQHCLLTHFPSSERCFPEESWCQGGGIKNDTGGWGGVEEDGQNMNFSKLPCPSDIWIGIRLNRGDHECGFSLL